MGLLQKLKSALGLDGASSPDAGTRSPSDVDVTVEREPSSDTEDAVKGTETASAGSETTEQPTDVGVETDDSTEPEPSVDADDAVADEGTVEDEATDSDSAEDGSAEDESVEPETADGAANPVTEISGIGPAYGQRLSEAGVETVGDLAAADADELAAATDISASRIEGWIDAATVY